MKELQHTFDQVKKEFKDVTLPSQNQTNHFVIYVTPWSTE